MKVLLVDDEEHIRKIGRLSLEAVGKFETVVAANAEQALALARTEQPDLILMDMMMPIMDGMAALAALQNAPALRGIPVVFMTAKVQPSEVELYMRMGALGVIEKPFDPMTLPDVIRQLMGTRAS